MAIDIPLQGHEVPYGGSPQFTVSSFTVSSVVMGPPKALETSSHKRVRNVCMQSLRKTRGYDVRADARAKFPNYTRKTSFHPEGGAHQRLNEW